jgi:hypothetical protein
MSNRRVLGLSLPGGYGTDYHFPGVHTDARLERKVPVFPQLGRIAPQFFLHPERRVERALRMVLVREGSTEQRENSVAGRLHDIAVVAAHGLDHQLEGGIDDCPRLLRIEVLHQLGRALDVREQRGHRLALALEFFGVGRLAYAKRRSVEFLCCSIGRPPECPAALSAKTFTGWIVGTAFWTKIREWRATIAAELLAGWIFSFAVSAAHFVCPVKRPAPRISSSAVEGPAGFTRTIAVRPAM